MIYLFNKSTSPRPKGTGDTTFIATDCQITGSLTVNGNVRIDGKIDGNVSASGELTVGPSAKITANIEAKTVCIAGEVHGDVKATNILELSSSARLYGDLCTSQLKIEQGAHFVGTSQLMANPKESPSGETVLETTLAKSREGRRRAHS